MSKKAKLRRQYCSDNQAFYDLKMPPLGGEPRPQRNGKLTWQGRSNEKNEKIDTGETPLGQVVRIFVTSISDD